MTPAIRLGSRLLTAPWWALLLAVAGAALFTALGFWQWQRAVYKQSLIDRYAEGGRVVATLGAASVDGLPRYSQVQVSGRYDGAHQFLLDNLTRDSMAGYEVLTPLLLESGHTLLVNRGWLPQPDQRRDLVPDIALSASEYLHVVGRLDALPVTGLEHGRAPPDVGADWPKRTSFPTRAELASALAQPVAQWQLLLAADQAHGFRRDWTVAGSGFGPDRHRAYAVQWWSLAALALVTLVVVNLKKA